MKSRYQEFPCDLCGSQEAVELPHCRKYTKGQLIHICKKCGFVYVKERRSSEEIAKIWSKELFADDDGASAGYTARIPAVKARQTYAADFIDSCIGLRNKKVYDIGAGEGQFLQIIRDQYGAKIFAIEPSSRNCRGLQKMGMPYFNGTIERYREGSSAQPDRADIVTLLWALENSGCCKSVLQHAYKILKPSGFVVVATGSRILVPFKKPLQTYLSENPVDTHCFRFSANTLRGILLKCQFKVVCVNRFIDSDILCMIAKKNQDSAKTETKDGKDDYRKVYDFFERWHRESSFYAE